MIGKYYKHFKGNMKPLKTCRISGDERLKSEIFLNFVVYEQNKQISRDL